MYATSSMLAGSARLMLLELDRRHLADRVMDRLRVPVDPRGGLPFDLGPAGPAAGAAMVDELGLVQADGRFHQRIVEGSPRRCLTEGAMRGSRSGWVKLIAVHCWRPASEWKHQAVGRELVRQRQLNYALSQCLLHDPVAQASQARVRSAGGRVRRRTEVTAVVKHRVPEPPSGQTKASWQALHRLNAALALRTQMNTRQPLEFNRARLMGSRGRSTGFRCRPWLRSLSRRPYWLPPRPA